MPDALEPLTGPQIRKVRETLGLAQDALARLARINPTTLSRLETGTGAALDPSFRIKVTRALADLVRRRNALPAR